MVRTTAGESEDRINRILADRWVHYPQGDMTLDYLADLLRGARRTRMPSLLVVGEPDVGKTTIMKKFMRAHPASFDAATGLSTREVLGLEAPPEADEGRLYAAILSAAGAPFARGRVIDLEHIVYEQLKRLGTRLLVIDETNNLVIGSGAAQRKTLAALRRLCNQLDLSLACFGTQEAMNAFTSDPQIEGRAIPHLLMRLKNDEEWAIIVRAVVTWFPLAKLSDVDAPFIRKVFELSGGSPGKMFRLLNMCAVHAIDTGTERISLDTLAQDGVARHVQTAAGMRRHMRTPVH